MTAVLAVLVLSLVAAACGGSDADEQGAGSSGSATAGTDGTAGPVLDASVLTGEATTVDGERFELGSLADRDLVVWFWAPW